MAKISENTLAEQLRTQRRTVDFDTFDFALRQILAMLEEGAIDVAPAYQRKFRWDDVRCSQLIESIYLGIPVPSLFMATNANSTWDLVDGLQRISSVVKFLGNGKLRAKLGLKNGPLRLTGLEKLKDFNGMAFEDLPRALQIQLELRPLKIITLSDKSDTVVRYDLFERLNRGGITLTDQEIRDCVYRGPVSVFLDEMSNDPNFTKLVRLTPKQERDGTRKECVLRFFAFFHNYKSFVHNVESFLTDYMKSASASFDASKGRALFQSTFQELARVLPNGIRRLSVRRKITPINLFEGVAVGGALAIQKSGKLKAKNPYRWLESKELKEFTSQATNSPKAVTGRIEFCRDKFLTA
jgi:hypothetical protein